MRVKAGPGDGVRIERFNLKQISMLSCAHRPLAAIVAAAILSACSAGKQADSLPPPPQMDASTPDRAVQSNFVLIDWRMQSWYSEYERYDKSNETVKYRELAAAVRSDKVQPVVKPRRLQTFDRTIEEVKVESESRAVVLVRIKNTTPLLPTEVPDKWDTEKRSKGDLYRYVLEKSGDNWRVAEVWEFADYISTWERRAPTDYRSPPSLTTEAAW